MLQTTTKHEVKKSGDFEAINFTFNASAHAFKIISDNLYSKPVEAIVRELACNAVDSHIKAGKNNVPFELKLPNRLDNTFYIRDYGTGITPQEIREIYTVVFKSDKNHTNDYTGCFGLGSKTPFSVVSQFSVESMIDGKKWIYSAFLDEKRVPTIADMSNGGFDTDEPNGVKVSFSVPSEKIGNFTNAAEQIFPYFELKPVVLGRTIKVEDTEYCQHEKGLYGLRKYINYYNSEPKAIMGNVCYAIDTSALGKEIPKQLDLYFEMGELTPTPSREHLQYDERTKKAIIEKYETFFNSFYDTSVKEINDAPTLIKARSLLSEFRKYPFVSKNLKIVDLKWQNKFFACLENLKLPHEVRAFSGGQELTSWNRKELSCVCFLNFTGCFVSVNEKTGFISKARHTSHRHNRRVVLLSTDDTERQEQIDFLKRDVGFDDLFFINSSDLEKPERHASTSKSYAQGIFKIFQPTCYIANRSYYWQEIKEEIDNDVYYVYASRGSWSKDVGSEMMHPSHLSKIVTNFRNLGFNIAVIGVIPSAKNKIPKNWKPLSEMTKIVEWLMQDKSVESAILTKKENTLNDLDQMAQPHRLYNSALVSELVDPDLKDFISRHYSLDWKNGRITSLEFLISELNLDFKDKFDKVRERVKKLENKYVLLGKIDSYNFDSKTQQHLYDYLNMIYNQQENKQL